MLALFIGVLFVLLFATLLSFVLRGKPQLYEYRHAERKDSKVRPADCRIAADAPRSKKKRSVPPDAEKAIELCGEEHFKYGSIGSDTLRQGLPYRIFLVLPIIFAEHLPRSGRQLPEKGAERYEAFGLIVERGQDGKRVEDRPVGFSKRRIFGLDIVGLNCAFCHASALRSSEGTIAGMPSPTLDVERFFAFLFQTARSPDFTADKLIKEIDKLPDMEPMNFLERAAYRWLLIPIYRRELGKLERKFCFIHRLHADCPSGNLEHDAGPGRMDLWAPYKVLQFKRWNRLFDLLPNLVPNFLDPADLPIGPAPGFADFSPMWEMEQRMGGGFHWDGNTRLVGDYTSIAALGMAIPPGGLDVLGFERLARWMRTHKPPRYEDEVPEAFKTVSSHLREAGRNLFERMCFDCHSPAGRRFGLVEPIDLIGTDRNRLDAFSEELARKLKEAGGTYASDVHRVEKTYGYSNVPLNGIWLRAPYLHNGSVPTLRDLLKPPAERPARFCRGSNVYDWANVGFDAPPARQDGAEPCAPLFLYDTKLPGNGNAGHLYGSDLEPHQKEVLVEYLKTL